MFFFSVSVKNDNMCIVCHHCYRGGTHMPAAGSTEHGRFACSTFFERAGTDPRSQSCAHPNMVYKTEDSVFHINCDGCPAVNIRGFWHCNACGQHDLCRECRSSPVGGTRACTPRPFCADQDSGLMPQAFAAMGDHSFVPVLALKLVLPFLLAAASPQSPEHERILRFLGCQCEEEAFAQMREKRAMVKANSAMFLAGQMWVTGATSSEFRTLTDEMSGHDVKSFSHKDADDWVSATSGGMIQNLFDKSLVEANVKMAAACVFGFVGGWNDTFESTTMVFAGQTVAAFVNKTSRSRYIKDGEDTRSAAVNLGHNTVAVYVTLDSVTGWESLLARVEETLARPPRQCTLTLPELEATSSQNMTTLLGVGDWRRINGGCYDLTEFSVGGMQQVNALGMKSVGVAQCAVTLRGGMGSPQVKIDTPYALVHVMVGESGDQREVLSVTKASMAPHSTDSY